MQLHRSGLACRWHTGASMRLFVTVVLALSLACSALASPRLLQDSGNRGDQDNGGDSYDYVDYQQDDQGEDYSLYDQSGGGPQGVPEWLRYKVLITNSSTPQLH